MTDQKALKHLVRERMTRTGEFYTTARRHVRAHAPAGPASLEDGVVAGFPAFGAEAHHSSARARHLLGASGLDLTEPMACGLGGGVGFMYAVFEYKQIDHPLLTIVAQHHPMPWLDVVAENLGLELETRHSTSASAARRKLDSCIDDGTPALLTVARGLLPQHPGVSPMEAADPYEVVVAGRRGDDYLVDDLASAPHVLTGAELSAAWAGHRKGRFKLTTVVAAGVDKVADNLDDSLAAGIHSALRMTSDHLTGPVLGNSFDVNFGLSGMHRLVTDLRDASTKNGWQRRFASPTLASYACGRLSECLTGVHTAPGATRPTYAKFLTEAADLLRAPRLAEAAALFERSGQGWTSLAEEAGALSRGEQVVDLPTVYSSFADTVENCRAFEEDAVDRIRDHLDGR